ncbi:MAG: hypothetical protein U0075_22705 [Thermomicrobiales bacterium]
MEEDVTGLERAAMGHDTVMCDLCGQPGSELSFERIEGVPGVAEPVEFVRVCRDCRDRLERGEIPLDAGLLPGLDSADDPGA